MQRLEAKCLLVASPAASLATYAVVRIGNAAKHLGRLFFVHFFGREHAMCTNLHAPTATDAFAVVN